MVEAGLFVARDLAELEAAGGGVGGAQVGASTGETAASASLSGRLRMAARSSPPTSAASSGDSSLAGVSHSSWLSSTRVAIKVEVSAGVAAATRKRVREVTGCSLQVAEAEAARIEHVVVADHHHRGAGNLPDR